MVQNPAATVNSICLSIQFCYSLVRWVPLLPEGLSFLFLDEKKRNKEKSSQNNHFSRTWPDAGPVFWQATAQY